MNLNLIFKAQGVVLIINGLGSLFLGSLWISQGTGWESTPDLITFGQFVGVVLLVNGIWSWRFPDIASENIKSMKAEGKIYTTENLNELLKAIGSNNVTDIYTESVFSEITKIRSFLMSPMNGLLSHKLSLPGGTTST